MWEPKHCSTLAPLCHRTTEDWENSIQHLTHVHTVRVYLVTYATPCSFVLCRYAPGQPMYPQEQVHNNNISRKTSIQKTGKGLDARSQKLKVRADKHKRTFYQRYRWKVYKLVRCNLTLAMRDMALANRSSLSTTAATFAGAISNAAYEEFLLGCRTVLRDIHTVAASHDKQKKLEQYDQEQRSNALI